MVKSHQKAQPPGDRRNSRQSRVPVPENRKVDEETRDLLKSTLSDSRRKEPVLSSKRASITARDLKLTLITDAKLLFSDKFTEKQRDRILTALLKFKATEAKHVLEECLETLYIHVNPQLAELVRIWRKGMLEKVYPEPSATHHKTVDKQFRHLLKQFQEKLDEKLDELRNECLDFLHYTYGDIDSESEVDDSADELVHSPAMGPRSSVVLAFDRSYGTFAGDSGSDTEMAELPARKYSAQPTIPEKVGPEQPGTVLGKNTFAKKRQG